MNYDKEFEKIYEIIVNNNSEELDFNTETIKKEKIKNIIIIILLVIVGKVLYDFIYKKVYPYDEFAHIFMFIYLVFIFIVYLKSILIANDYIFSSNKIVLKVLFDYFRESFNYFPDKGISSDLYNDAEFEKYTGYYTANLIQCKLKNNCNLFMSEVTTEYRMGKSYFPTLFSGMVAELELSKTFNVNLCIREKILASYCTKLPNQNLKVELDLQDFDVYCSNKNLVNEILTDDVINLLQDFKKEINNEYEVVIKNNVIYIRFMCSELFNFVNIEKRKIEKINLYKYYKILEFIFKLTDELMKLSIGTAVEE